mgnify:CR=1 FL=1|jgi:hypothetical protein
MASRGFLAAAMVPALLLAHTPAWAQQVRLLGDFNAWSAYAASEGGGTICFALTEPTETAPAPEGAGQGYLYLTHRPGEGVRNEVNLVAGFDLAPDSTATATVGGSSFTLFTQGDAAWLDDPGQSESLASAIRAGSTLTIEATSAAGIRVTQRFSLSGATAASQAIGNECG